MTTLTLDEMRTLHGDEIRRPRGAICGVLTGLVFGLTFTGRFVPAALVYLVTDGIRSALEKTLEQIPGTEPGANAYGVLVDRPSTVQRRRTSFVPGWESFTSTSTPSFYTLTHAENVTADPNYPT